MMKSIFFVLLVWANVALAATVKLSDLEAATSAAPTDITMVADPTGVANPKKITFSNLKISLGVPTAYVTSVAMSAPGIFSLSGSPITGAGTLALSLTTQSANQVWAGPATGSAAVPTFRSLVVADIPNLGSIYQSPLTFSTGLTNTANTITVNIAQNISQLSNLTTNGFVKVSGSNGTLSVDTNSYVTTGITVNGHVLTSNVVISKGDVGLPNVLNVAQEPALGNPGTNGYVLSSLTNGTRSWVASSSFDPANPGNIGTGTPGTGVFTTLSASGQIKASDGSAGAPSYAFTSDLTSGFFMDFNGRQHYSSGGADAFILGTSIVFGSTGKLYWCSGTPDVTTIDLSLVRIAANTLAQRNGANAQTLILGESGVALGELQCSKVTWFGGASITKVLTAAASLTFGNIAANSVVDLTITVTGATQGDPVFIGPPVSDGNSTATFTGWVSAANTVTVRCANVAIAPTSVGTETFKVIVMTAQ